LNDLTSGALAIALTLLAVGVSFTVSASAGLGGFLILVPTLALILGTKEGVALAALLSALNNVVKVIAYRKSLPFRQALVVIVLVAIGAVIGARLLVAAPEEIVTIAVIASFALALIAERMDLSRLRAVGGPVLALVSGATSGFSGRRDRSKEWRFVSLTWIETISSVLLLWLPLPAAAKTAVVAEAQLLGSSSLVIAALAVSLMILGTFSGRSINHAIGERG
jgi:hypothetical protein